MTLLRLGVDHHATPVEVRERLSLAEGMAGLWPALASHCDEVVLLATCNRLELYAVAADAATARLAIVAALADAADFPVAELAARLTVEQDGAVARHLCQVAAGLDSMVLGEAQILGQVRAALQEAQVAGAAGPCLSLLFRQAMTAGKRARTETGIGASAASVSHAAVQLARRIFGSLEGSAALLVGAGETAALAARNLLAHGVGQLAVANRTLAHAEALAGQFGGSALPLTELAAALGRCDIVITSTGAHEPIIDAPLMRQVMRGRRGRPLFLIDIAVPRDVAADVAALDNVFLYDIDDLEALVAANLDRRRSEVARVEAICAEEAARVVAWLESRGAAPTIAALRERAESIRQGELERLAGRLQALDQREWDAVQQLTRGIINKLLHEPTVQLKSRAADRSIDYTGLVRELFRLDRPEPAP